MVARMCNQRPLSPLSTVAETLGEALGAAEFQWDFRGPGSFSSRVEIRLVMAFRT